MRFGKKTRTTEFIKDYRTYHGSEGRVLFEVSEKLASACFSKIQEKRRCNQSIIKIRKVIRCREKGKSVQFIVSFFLRRVTLKLHSSANESREIFHDGR